MKRVHNPVLYSVHAAVLLTSSPLTFNAGNLFGMTLSVQPGEFGFVSEGRNAIISCGVVYSLPGQKGQKPPFFLCEGDAKSVGRLPLSTEIITQRPDIGSFLSSDMSPPYSGILETHRIWATPSLTGTRRKRRELLHELYIKRGYAPFSWISAIRFKFAIIISQ